MTTDGWVEDDGLVSNLRYGYWAFHEYREYEDWTDEEHAVLEGAAQMLAKYLNENWPRG